MTLHQVAGHQGNFESLDNHLIKLQTHKEKEFYEAVKDNPTLKGVIPQYFGEWDLNGKPGMRLENVIHGYQKPMLMDIKLGKILYGMDATPEKKERMEQQALTTTSGTTGLRICGMKLWDQVKNDFVHHDKSFGRALTKETLHKGFEAYFVNDIHENKKCLYEKVLFIRNQVSQVSLRAGGCSLLLAYEFGAKKAEARLIDFAHAHIVDQGPDQDLLWALDSLLLFLG
jgi:hypothetical protein